MSNTKIISVAVNVNEKTGSLSLPIRGSEKNGIDGKWYPQPIGNHFLNFNPNRDNPQVFDVTVNIHPRFHKDLFTAVVDNIKLTAWSSKDMEVSNES